MYDCSNMQSIIILSKAPLSTLISIELFAFAIYY